MTKYRAVKTKVDGITFDSRHEASVWYLLCLMQRAGKISGLKRQVPFVLVPKGGKVKRARKYIADFTFTEKGRFVVADAKGVATKEYILKRDVLLWQHPEIDIFREYRANEEVKEWK